MAKNKVVVTVKFIYDKEKGKDKQYYADKAFDEIYQADDLVSITINDVEL